MSARRLEPFAWQGVLGLISFPIGWQFSPTQMKLCLFLSLQDILKDQWSPALTIKTALLSLQALMCSPEPGDPQDAQVAKMYLSNRSKFDQTAKFWTETYAILKGNNEEVLKRVTEMGFDREKAKHALEKYGWDESAAVNELLGAL